MTRKLFQKLPKIPLFTKPARTKLRLETLEYRDVPSVNPIVQENLLPGSPANDWAIVGSGDPTLQGYATDISVDQGETVYFKINNPQLAEYHIDIFRIGYYQGLGARKVGTISNPLRQSQPAPLTNSATGLVDAGNWAVSASWAVPSDATSGVYIAVLKNHVTNNASHIIFVVRDDDGGSDMLFQTSDTTWQAYNGWGGNSLYVGSPGQNPGRGYAVSYNRPFDTASRTPKDWFFADEYPMVRFLEQNGYNVSYFTGVDSDRRGSEILEHSIFLSVGHDEYWSGQQRANVEAARDAGVNLAFLSGNEMYWRTRWETSIDGSGTSHRTLVSYKESMNNADIDPTNQWTGTFRDPRFPTQIGAGVPENAVTGQIFTVNRGPGGDTGTSFSVPAEYANLRFWRNTSVASLQPGQTATLGDHVLGYEWDEDLDNGFRPAGLFQMSETTQISPSYLASGYGALNDFISNGVATHSLTLYRASSGALVFGAGTVNWAWGLDGVHDVLPTTPDPAIQQATINLFADMGVQPETLMLGMVPASMSFDIVAPTTSITSISSGATVTAGTLVTISGTAGDIGGGVVGAVEVSVDGGISWRRASGRSNWTYAWTPTPLQAGQTTILARASDDSGNLQTAMTPVNVTVVLQQTATTGLVAAYNFNAGSGTSLANAVSGGGNTGTISGATWVPGHTGQALSFDGIDDLVTIADSNSLDLTNGMTLEAWVKPSDLQGWTTVVMKERNGDSLAYGLYASDNTENPPATYIFTGTENQSAGNAALPLDTWTHLAATYDGSSLKLYMNGSLVRSTPVTGSIATSTGSLRIGGNSVYVDEFFKGIIDDVRIYNRALGASEIFTDMSTPVGGTIDSIAPTSSITSPANGSTVSGIVTLTSNATDLTGISGVKYYVDGQYIGEDKAAPYSIGWNTALLGNGSHTLSAVARDFAGNQTTSSSVNVTVNNSADLTAPLVHLTSLPNGARVSGTLPIMAVASDNIAVASVDFQVNGVSIGTDTAAPFAVSWNTNTMANGTYNVVAIAKDAANNQASSTTFQVTVDNVAPTVTSHSPASSATGVSAGALITATLSESILPNTILFVLKDIDDNSIPAIVTYDDATKRITLDPTQDLGLGAVYTASLSGVRDLANNTLSTVTWSFTTSTNVTNASFWNNTATPTTASAFDTQAVEVGMKFRVEVDGYITGLRFFKGESNTGTHVGHLWTATGSLLGSVTFTNETSSGWQSATFSNPISISANTTYVVSYFAPVGGYSVDANFFASDLSSGPLTALADGDEGGNGLFKYGPGGGFPTDSYNAGNYWVDVSFSNTLGDIVAPTVIARTPSISATGVSQTANVVATFGEAVQESTISLVLRDSANSVVPANVNYNPTTHVVTLDPSANLAAFAAYTATLSGAQDAAGNTMETVIWSFTTGGIDTTAPTVINRTPLPNATNASTTPVITATFDEPVNRDTISLVLLDDANQQVHASVLYSEATNTASIIPVPLDGPPIGCCGACGVHCPLTNGRTYTVILSAVEDMAGNVMDSLQWTFTTAEAVTNASLFEPTSVPSVASVNDNSPVEVGVKFQSTIDGFATGLRFYKGAFNTGTHVGRIWDLNGNPIASATFTDETSGGWQEVQFASPVRLNANTQYVASYYAPNGGYAFTSNYFTNSVTNGVMTAPSSAVSNGNGVYRYGAGGGFPNSSFNSSNYWVDVVFGNSLSDLTAPAITARTPSPGASEVSTGTSVVVTFDEPVDEASLTFDLKDLAGNSVGSTWSYDTLTNTVTLGPTSTLAGSATYTATLSGVKDAAGNMMATTSWSFTTGGIISNASLWTTGVTPTNASANDTASVELGVKFQADRNGYITGVRFYKGTTNTGNHIANFWTSSGTLLASANFTSESASGWQEVNFELPVAIDADTTYVASYYAPNGGYAYDHGYFNSTFTNGPLTTPSTTSANGNGLFRYGLGGGFPSNSYNGSNYWVDVVFTESLGDTVAPTVTGNTPTDNAAGVSGTTVVSATLSELVQGNTIAFVLKDQLNNMVSSSFAYEAITNRVTLTPSVALLPLTTYTATLSGATDAAGNVIAPTSWSFTILGVWSQATVAEFNGGSHQGTSATGQGNGAIQLTPSFLEDFGSSALSGNWSSNAWGGGSSIALADGAMSIQGSQVLSSAVYVNKPLEAMVSFGSTPYQHFGWATGFDSVGGNSWAIFSTGGTSDRLFARVNSLGAAQQDVDIGALPSGYHKYRIEPSSEGFKFYVDDSLVTTVGISLSSTNLRIAYSSYNSAPAPALKADWVRVADYASTGTFSSSVFDAGTTVTWQSVDWTALVPQGTSVRVEISVSDSSNPTTPNWIEVSDGQLMSGVSGRYIQFRLIFETTGGSLSPIVEDMMLTYY